MSSGLCIIAPQVPDCNPRGACPDHAYLYNGSADLFRYAATRPQQWLPGKIGRYHNSDPMLAM